MPFPPDPRVLALLSVFHDVDAPGSHRYHPASWCRVERYTHGSRAGSLDVTVWTHASTAWVCLRGLLSRRAAHALAARLGPAEVTDIVLNTADLTLPTASGGTPLVTLCATLSYAGHSVTVVGRDDEVAAGGVDVDGLDVGHRRELLSRTGS